MLAKSEKIDVLPQIKAWKKSSRLRVYGKMGHNGYFFHGQIEKEPTIIWQPQSSSTSLGTTQATLVDSHNVTLDFETKIFILAAQTSQTIIPLRYATIDVGGSCVDTLQIGVGTYHMAFIVSQFTPTRHACKGSRFAYDHGLLEASVYMIA